jgi:hypothetical protein
MTVIVEDIGILATYLCCVLLSNNLVYVFMPFSVTVTPWTAVCGKSLRLRRVVSEQIDILWHMSKLLWQWWPAIYAVFLAVVLPVSHTAYLATPFRVTHIDIAGCQGWVTAHNTAPACGMFINQ